MNLFITLLENVNKSRTSANNVSLSACFDTNTSDFPSELPSIGTKATKEPLEDGDTITCTIKAVKAVAVNLTCKDPPLMDQPDDTDGTDVTSSVIVNTSLAQGTTMTCMCNAYWQPSPKDYMSATVNKTFQILIKGKLKQSPKFGLLT
jgi:hypothetical protein